MILSKYLHRLKKVKQQIEQQEEVPEQMIIFYTVEKDGTISADDYGWQQFSFANKAEMDDYIKEQEAAGRELVQCDDISDLWDDHKQ